MSDDLMKELAAEAAEEAERPKSEGALEALQTLAARANALDNDIEAWEAKIEEAKKEKNDILQRKMVDVMNDVKVSSTTVDGKVFNLENYYHASIQEENQDAAHNWLEENEYGDLIKYQIVLTLPKEAHELAKKVEATVRQMSNEIQVDTKRQVPWKRLTSWLKEYVEEVRANDPELPAPPLDLLGATVGRVVKIKKSRKK